MSTPADEGIEAARRDDRERREGRTFTQEQAAAMHAALKVIAAFPNARANVNLTLSEAIDEMAEIACAAVFKAEGRT